MRGLSFKKNISYGTAKKENCAKALPSLYDNEFGEPFGLVRSDWWLPLVKNAYLNILLKRDSLSNNGVTNCIVTDCTNVS